ncbi:MAG TPA: tetratricopeptide repeat protein [Ktedonobacteraceae bacterium]|jgi:tetratricopeptide (TPR) repeat protein/transcriptional regulator with XRE-family HTH domain
MKKAANASPNRALRRERELRCWSQVEVADRVGTTAFNVGRWERGITFPGAYFRQQLCAIFEKSPQELGLLHLAEEEEEAVPPTSSREESPKEETGGARPPLSPAVEICLPIWSLPWRRNPFFTGRAEILQALHAAFNADEDGPGQALAICGLGGIGKTQTAIEYAYRYRDAYQLVFWIRAETSELLIADFTSLAAALALPEQHDQNQSHIVAAVKRWLSRQSRWLLVLDNVEDLGVVSEFLPETIGGHLLLTTRMQSTGQIAQQIRLEKLSPQESILFLLRRAKLLASPVLPDNLPQDHWLVARDVARTMDGLPLALDQAAAYIEETGCGLRGYLERYRQRRITLLRRRGGLLPEHPESVVATWSLSFEKIERRCPAAAELLYLCAFLHPDALAEHIITTGASELTPELHVLATDPIELDEAIGVLTTFSLLRRDPDRHTLSLHRLLQVVLREHMSEQTRRLWAERAVHVVERAFPQVSFTTWQECQLCLPHALACAELIEQLDLQLPESIRLLNKAGSYLRERAQYAEAQRLLSRSLALGEQTLAPDAPLLAESLHHLGILAQDQGKYTWSEELLQRALTIYRQIWGSEHLTVAQCLSNQAENYRVLARLAEMETLAQQALAIREQALGPDHPDVGKSLTQLAALYHGQGKYARAEPLYQRALAICQQAWGPEHIDVAAILNNLASLYDSLGRYAEAEPLYQRALAFCEKQLGDQHIYTAISLYNLAETYRSQGDYVRATPLHQRALAIREQTLGAGHPHVGKSLNLLAEIALTQQQYTTAEAQASRALAIWEQALGEDHHYIAIGVDTLARVRRAQHRLAEGETLARRAVQIFQHLWGDDSHVAGSFNTLAEILCDQLACEQAEQLLLDALEIQERLLGPAHPHTARSLHNLGTLCLARQDYSRAEGYLTRALAIRRHALRPQHADLIASLQQYAELVRQTEPRAPLPALEESAAYAHARRDAQGSPGYPV